MIFDGGSNDGSVDIIKKYEKYLSYWESVPDKGQSHAINKGLTRATGEIFNWLNSDDYYEPEALQTIAASFEDPTVMMVSGRSRLFKDNNITVAYSKGADIYPGNLAKTIGQARIDQPETFFRLKAISEIGYLDDRLHYLMDRDLWIRFLLRYGLEPTRRIDNILVNFRLHDSSKTVSQVSGFEQESYLMYRSLALSAGAYSVQQALSDIYSDGSEYEYLVDDAQRQLICQSLHYFLLYLADHFYYQGMDGQSRQILKAIERHYISKEEQFRIKKIRFRSRWIPFWMRKLARNK